MKEKFDVTASCNFYGTVRLHRCLVGLTVKRSLSPLLVARAMAFLAHSRVAAHLGPAQHEIFHHRPQTVPGQDNPNGDVNGAQYGLGSWSLSAVDGSSEDVPSDLSFCFAVAKILEVDANEQGHEDCDQGSTVDLEECDERLRARKWARGSPTAYHLNVGPHSRKSADCLSRGCEKCVR